MSLRIRLRFKRLHTYSSNERHLHLQAAQEQQQSEGPDAAPAPSAHAHPGNPSDDPKKPSDDSEADDGEDADLDAIETDATPVFDELDEELMRIRLGLQAEQGLDALEAAGLSSSMLRRYVGLEAERSRTRSCLADAPLEVRPWPQKERTIIVFSKFF